MRPPRFTGWWLISAIVVLSVTVMFAQQAKKVDENAIKNAGKTGEEWLTYGLDYAETRYSPLKQIDATNVKRLGLAWSAEIGNGGGAQEDTPLDFQRRHLRGHQLEHRLRGRCTHRKREMAMGSRVNQTLIQRRICCGNVNRGLGIYQRKDLCSRHRRPTCRTGCRNRQGSVDGSDHPSRIKTTPSPWPLEL